MKGVIMIYNYETLKLTAVIEFTAESSSNVKAKDLEALKKAVSKDYNSNIAKAYQSVGG
ncbi:MAG: hypothetical protein HRT57_06180 [Crocinitomicaceae bacterium]|nr:hypothetical protein [Crocinitomicaceae bacterium]